MAKVELTKGKKTIKCALIDVEGWATTGYKISQASFDALANDEEREYVENALKRGAASAKGKEGGE